MKKLTVICVEDERETLERLSEILTHLPGVSFGGGASNLTDARHLIDSQQPDVVLLDVDLGEESGFDLLEQTVKRDFKVIFCTAHEEHALKAIKFSALDYLLKPFTKDDLEGALTKARTGVADHQERVQLYLENLKVVQLHDQRIALSSSECIVYVRVGDLIRGHSDGNYTEFFTSSGERHVVSTTLARFDELLEPAGFMRVHRSHLINLRHVERYIRQDGGAVKMTDGSLIEVSRRRKDELLAELAKLTP